MFKFGMNDLKVVKEFQSALHFLIFKMKYDLFSENFGKIKFPIDFNFKREKSDNELKYNNT